jgi:site-specific DNA-cytosine methylase
MTSLTLRSPTKPTSAANTPITKQPSIASFFSKASSTPSVPPFGQRNDETNVTTKPSSRNALTAPAKGTSFDSDSDDDIPVIKKRKVSQLNMSTIRTDLDRKSNSPSSAFAGTPKAGPNSLTVDTPSKQEEKPQATAAASSKRRLGQQGLWGREVVQIKKKGGGKVTGSANAGDSFEYNQGFHDYLPPISDIYDIFDDMTKNLEKNQRRIGTNMKEAFEHIGVRKLRVGTMCSGTESPVLALGMISKSLKKLFDIDFNIDHLFSAEIVPFKQAFIERNFAPPVIFRDIKEMLSSTIEATSAYGAMTPIPTDLDLLIAGFSCVDFSNLNNYKRKMEEVGESGDTLRAILAYAEKHRPRIIVLENVFGAPWDKIQEVWEKTVGYHCTWARFDTKDYYIPHTRQRGYMICIDKSQLPKGQRAMKDWQALVVAIQRPASSPIDTFTVDEDHPLMQRAREELARNLRADDKITKSSEWIKCLARHHDTRERLHLGIKRPYCKWVDGGSSFLPDWCWTDWGKAQTERVWDTLEISYLRNARRGFDMRYKT